MTDTILEYRRFLPAQEPNRQRGVDRYNAKLTEAQVREIRSRMGEKNIALAAEFGCSKSNIEFIKARKTWAHIP